MARIRFRPDSVVRAGRALSARLPELTTLGLVLVLAYLAAELAWQLAAPEPRTSTMQVGTSRAGSRPSASDTGVAQSSVERLLKADLFGTPKAASESPDKRAKKDAPETNLDLELSGIVAADEGKESRAIIAVGNKPEKSFGVGDTLTDQVVLDTIYADRVLIRRNGQLEALHLPRPESVGTNGASRLSGSSNSGGNVSMASLRERVLENPASIAEYIRVRPVRRNGQIQGFRVRPGPDRAIFDQMDLEPGDIVREVNGVTLDSQDKGLDLMGKLRNADRIRLRVERNGRTRTVEASLDN